MTPLLPNIVAVQVPEGAKQIIVVGNQVRYKMNTLKFWWDNIVLPPGSYTLLFLSTEATEYNVREIVMKDAHYSRQASFNPGVGHYQTSGSSTTFKDYVSGHCTLDTALASFHSLLKSKGLEGNCVILKKEV